MGHTEIIVTINVYGHLFGGARHQLVSADLDALRPRTGAGALTPDDGETLPLAPTEEASEKSLEK